MRLALLIAVWLSLSGCVKDYRITTPFNDADFAGYSKTGLSTIAGQAFLKTKGGDVKFGAGNQITLYPYTSYVQEVLSMKKRPNYKIKNEDTRWMQYIKTTIADAQGKFEFKNIPAGNYLIECGIFWQVPGQYGLQTTGDIVSKQVSVGNNDSINIMLTE